MESSRIIRKIQFRQGSYTVTIPRQIVRTLGIKRDQYVEFVISNNCLTVNPIRLNPAGDATNHESADSADEQGRVYDAADRRQETDTSKFEGLRM